MPNNNAIAILSKVSIGDNGAENSAVLELIASNKGLLIPKVSLVSKNLPDPINNPALGLLVYNVNTSQSGNIYPGFYAWNGNEWLRLIFDSDSVNASGNFWSLEGNSGTTPWNGTQGNFIGTTDGANLVLGNNNVNTPSDVIIITGNQKALVITKPGDINNPNPGEYAIYRGDGDPRGFAAVDLQVIRFNPSEVASGPGSVISGGVANTASGSDSTVGGGGGNTASGSYSTVGGGSG
ncbi:MAG: hypothetical protein QW255_04540, partial [Candidatus Bilamarchaeaceae archaeon]